MLLGQRGSGKEQNDLQGQDQSSGSCHRGAQGLRNSPLLCKARRNKANRKCVAQNVWRIFEAQVGAPSRRKYGCQARPRVSPEERFARVKLKNYSEKGSYAK